jgi:hypothetical protein
LTQNVGATACFMRFFALTGTLILLSASLADIRPGTAVDLTGHFFLIYCH